MFLLFMLLGVGLIVEICFFTLEIEIGATHEWIKYFKLTSKNVFQLYGIGTINPSSYDSDM